MKRKIAIEIISFLFILLFVYAALTKLIDYQKFQVQIGQSPLLTGFGNYIPWMVIGVEILISVLLVIPQLRFIALVAAFSIMTMFTAYIIAILKFSPYVPCSCGGVIENLGWMEHLLLNAAFVLLAVSGIVLQAQDNNIKRENETIMG